MTPVGKSDGAKTNSEHLAAVDRALRHILRDLDSPTRLADVAEVAGFSPHHFNRIFSATLGESVMELSRRVRLERAAYRLRSTEESVTQLAYEAGYESYEAFSRAFRAVFGASPRSYRTTVGLPHVVGNPSGIHWSPKGGIGALSPNRTGESALNFEVVSFPALRVAAWRHVGPHPTIHQTWERLQSLLEERSWTDARCFSLFLNSPEETAPERLETDLCFSVPAEFEPRDGLHVFELPAGEYVSFQHEGIDADLGDAWQRLFSEWLPRSGRGCVGPCFEEYVHGWSPRLGKVTTAVYVGVGPRPEPTGQFERHQASV